MANLNQQAVKLVYLENTPSSHHGLSFSAPWPRGNHFASSAHFFCSGIDGEDVALQSWVTAYWPDESIKWTAHAISASDTPQSEYFVRCTSKKGTLQVQRNEVPTSSLRYTSTSDRLEVSTGRIAVQFGTSGPYIIKSIISGHRGVIGRNGRLLLLSQNKPEDESWSDPQVERYEFESVVDKTILEQSGPIRAVVKIVGKHHAIQSSKSPGNPNHAAWLPFVIRVYLYAGSAAIKITHTILYDGDAEKDVIRGIGIRFEVPLKAEELVDRHVRLSGVPDGIFGEAVQGVTGLRKDPGHGIKEAQVEGRTTIPFEEWDPTFVSHLKWVPSWSDYRLLQHSPDGFTLKKRTKSGKSWVNISGGGKAGGLVYLGGANTGGLAIGMRDFAERYPTGLDIQNAADDVGQITAWLYSPSAEPMFLGQYHDGLEQKTYDDQLDALTMTYEDWEDKTGSPYGIARTNELYLYSFDSTPASSTLATLSKYVQSPPVLLPDQRTLSQTEVFGSDVPRDVTINPSGGEKETIDKNLDFLFHFYKDQIAQRRWYGFWDHGDVMHTYDQDRHQWRYDIGGYAWDNSELSPDLWLWLYFLQTRKSEVFRVAEALTRHTGEVDVYHIGDFKGLGTRHGVQHWSDSCKQLRISNAFYRRHFYYLSGADERIGDLLQECLHGEDTLVTLDPYRKVRKDKTTYQPSSEAVSISLGTDWSALAAAWLVEIERRGPRAQEVESKLMRSMEGIGALKNGFVTGMAIYNTRTGDVTPPNEDPENKGHVQVSHLSAMFGLVEVCAELLKVYGDTIPNGFGIAWLEYCHYFNASAEEQLARFGVSFANLQLRQGHSRLTAYAASRRHDPNLARRAWEEFYTGDGYGPELPWKSNLVDGSKALVPIHEAPWISTNITSLYGLAAIQNLSLIGDVLPKGDSQSNRKAERSGSS